MTVTVEQTGRDTSPVLQPVPGLIFTPRFSSSGCSSYQIEDCDRGRFFQVGVPEYLLISLLDGRTTLESALRLARQTTAGRNLSRGDAEAIVRWLLENRLAVPAVVGQAAETPVQTSAPKLRRHPLFMQIPLFNPDRLLSRLCPLLSWLHSPLLLVVWAMIVLMALYRIGCQWPRFTAASAGILAPDNWLWLIGVWLVLKVLHEFAHGLVCKRYGGKVGSMGIMLILLAPLAYVDVTSSWRFPSRWQRIHVALAGIHLEIGLAALAALAWSVAEPGLLSHRLYSVILIGGVPALLFNANPFMRADGYYVLSDLTGIANLYPAAMQQVKGLVHHAMVGTPIPALPHPPRIRLLIRLYGIAVWMWRVTVYTGFIIAASAMFSGAGIFLAAGCAVTFFVRPVYNLATLIVHRVRDRQISVVRPILCVATLLLTVGLPSLALSWTRNCTAPGVVQYSPHAVVRADTGGFLTDLQVVDNQPVEQGQLLAVLANDELQSRFNRLQLEVAASELNCRLMLRQGRTAEHRLERERLAGLQEQRRTLQEEVDALSIHAPITGRVIARRIESLRGTWLESGEEILAIGGTGGRELRISVDQSDLPAITEQFGQRVRVRLPGRAAFAGTVSQITPRGDTQVSLPQLSAVNGGPLPVRMTEQPAAGGADAVYRLLAPRFDATVRIDNPTGALRAGELGVVTWPGERVTLAERVIEGLQRWLRTRTDQATAEAG